MGSRSFSTKQAEIESSLEPPHECGIRKRRAKLRAAFSTFESSDQGTSPEIAFDNAFDFVVDTRPELSV